MFQVALLHQKPLFVDVFDINKPWCDNVRVHFIVLNAIVSLNSIIIDCVSVVVFLSLFDHLKYLQCNKLLLVFVAGIGKEVKCQWFDWLVKWPHGYRDRT